MKRLATFTCIAVAILVFRHSTQGAGFQRMAIPRGTVLKLAPKGSGLAKAFCIDPHLRVPAPGLSYANVVAGGNQAIVKIGAREIPLQKAIDQGLVSARGNVYSFEQAARELRMNPATLTPEQRSFVTAYQQARADPADFGSLEFISHTKEPIEIEFRESGVISPDSAQVASALDQRVLKAIENATQETGTTHQEIQSQLWELRGQAHLERLGYAVRGERAEIEIQRFQKDYGVRLSGELDTPTTEAVHRSLTMAEIRPADADIARAVGLELKHQRLGHESLYNVFDENGRLVLATDDAAKAAEKLSAAKDKADIFVDAKGFTQDERVVLEKTLNENGASRVRVIERETADYPNSFLTRGNTKLLDAEPVIREVQGDVLPYAMDLSFAAQGETVRLTFFGKTKQVLKNAFSRIKALFVTRDVTEMSVAELVAACRADLRKLNNLTDAALQVRLNGTLRKSQIVQLYTPQSRRAA